MSRSAPDCGFGLNPFQFVYYSTRVFYPFTSDEAMMSFRWEDDLDLRTMYPIDKPGDLRSRVLNAYDDRKITDGMRARLKSDISKIKVAAECKRDLFQLMSSILTSVSLDLTPSDAKGVLIFMPFLTGGGVPNNDFKSAENAVHELVSFFSTRQDALKVASGGYFSDSEISGKDAADADVNEESKDDHSAFEKDKKRPIHVPSLYCLVVPVRISTKIDVVPRHLRFISQVSKHRHNSTMQYAMITNLGCFKLFAIGLDLQWEWEEVSWAAEDCIAKLYTAMKLIHDEAARATIPTLTHVIEDEGANVVLYSVTTRNEQEYHLLPIYHGRGQHHKTFVSLAISEGDPGDVRLFKFKWYEDVKITREREILQMIGNVEGVVHMDDELSDILAHTEPESDRVRCLLVLSTIGYPLCSCESVLEFLEAMYDALEVLRYLVEGKHILHRDISWGNILIRPKYGSKKVEPLPKKYRFISDIYGEDGPRVRVALSDFDHSFSYDKHSKEELNGRIGTPMFMANDIIYPRYVYDGEVRPVIIKIAQKAAAGDFEGIYADSKERARWDDFYAALDQVRYGVDDDYETRRSARHIDETAKHCAMHDAESIYLICMLFAIRMRRRGSMEEDAHRKRASMFNALARKRPGSPCTRAFDVHSYVEKNEADETLLPMVDAMAAYFAIPWHNVESTGRGEPLEFHAHNFLQRLLLKEIRKLRDSKDVILLEKNPLRIKSFEWDDMRCCSNNLANMLSKITKGKDPPPESSSSYQSDISVPNLPANLPISEVRFTTFAEQKFRFPIYFWDILKWNTRMRKWVFAERPSI